MAGPLSRRPWAAVSVGLGLVALAVARFWFVIHPSAARRGALPGDFGLGVEGSFYHQLKRGLVPLWDTTLGTGTLFFGGGTHHPTYTISHIHLLYPFNVLFLGLAERQQAIPLYALTLLHVLHYVLASAFAYAYGRGLGLSRAAAILAGTVYAYSGFLASHVSHWTMVDTVTWLPLVLLAGRRVLEGRRRWIAGGAVALAVAFLAGYPGLFLLIVLALGLQAAWELAPRGADQDPRAMIPPLRRLAAMGALAAGLAAIQILPLWESTTGSHQARLGFDWKAEGSLPPAALAGLVLPQPFQGAAWWEGNRSEYFLYAGLLTLVLAAVAAWRRRDRVVGFHAVLGGLGLLIAFGRHLELFRLLVDLVPGFAYFRYPSRAVILLHVALAVLAGLGLDALRAPGSDPRPLGPIRRGLAAAAAVGGLGAILLLVAVSAALTAGPVLVALTGLLGQVLVALGLLALAAVVLAARPQRVAPLALAVTVGELLLWASPLPYTAPGQQDRLVRDPPEVVGFLRAQPGPFRIGTSPRALHAQHIHAYGLSVYNSESRFSPQSYLDLYFAIPRNPRLLDLLNVRYLVGMAPPAHRGRYADLHVGSEQRQKVLPAPGTPVTTGRLVSHLTGAREVPQGTEVARLLFRDAGGREVAWPIRAGRETAEWTVDRPGDRPAHGAARVAASAPAEGGRYQGHDYLATLAVPVPIAVVEVELRYLAPAGRLTLRQLRVGDADLGADQGRFRPVASGVLENRDVLPRAFLVPRARAMPNRGALLSALEGLEPERELLLIRPDPADVIADGWEARGEVVITRYEPERVEIRAEVRERPQYLLLTDHWERWWRATVDGRPARILQANRDLRALRLPPGRHEVVFTLAYPLFAVGATISAVALVVAGGVLALAGRERARG